MREVWFGILTTADGKASKKSLIVENALDLNEKLQVCLFN
jgi:hypothetical protein